MARRLLVVAAVLGLSIGTAFAQQVDARAALLASMKAMGGENLRTIEITGAGASSLIGQQYSIEGNWPQFEVADYTRTIDFDAKWSREDYTSSSRAPLTLSSKLSTAGHIICSSPIWK